MKATRKKIGYFLKYGTLLSTTGFVVSTIIQIYARFFMQSAPSWTEEASRFFFIYAVSFASGLAMKGSYYVRFDVVYNKLKPKYQNQLQVLVSVFTIFLFLILSVYAIQFVKVGLPEHSPSLSASMAIAFSSMLVMGIFITLYAFWDLLGIIKKLKHKS